jgi:hypothetical protein
MTRFAGFAALALCATLGAGCMMMGDGDDSWDVGANVGDLSAGGAPLVMCRSIENRLRGLEVSVFRVIDHDQLWAVKHEGRLVCVDDSATVRRAGVTPLDDSTEEPCSFCDGTPLPASIVTDDEVAGPVADRK